MISLRPSSLFIPAASKSVLDVAAVGTVFSVGVSVGREGLSAGRADEFVVGFPAHKIEMRVPPAIPATVTAELFELPPWNLNDRLPTAFTCFPLFRG